MKKTFILTIICFLAFGFLVQTKVKAQTNQVATLEQANEELKKQLWILKQEFRETNTEQEARLDSLLNVLSYTQDVVNKQSGSLQTTGEKIVNLEVETETQKEGVADYIYNNRVNMIIAFLLIVIFNIIIFLILRNRLNTNYRHTENKFNEAFLVFDDDIKAASSMLNKHIKEVKETLDGQITNTTETIEKQISTISELIDKKTEANKIFFDEHVEKTKEEITKDIKAAKDNFKKGIKKTGAEYDEKLENMMSSLDNKFKDQAKAIDDKIKKISEKK